MEAHPQVPDAYRQEFLAGTAQDTAWVVEPGGTVKAPYGRLRNALTTLEETLTGTPEKAELVSITGP